MAVLALAQLARPLKGKKHTWQPQERCHRGHSWNLRGLHGWYGPPQLDSSPGLFLAGYYCETFYYNCPRSLNRWCQSSLKNQQRKFLLFHPCAWPRSHHVRSTKSARWCHWLVSYRKWTFRLRNEALLKTFQSQQLKTPSSSTSKADARNSSPPPNKHGTEMEPFKEDSSPERTPFQVPCLFGRA